VELVGGKVVMEAGCQGNGLVNKSWGFLSWALTHRSICTAWLCRLPCPSRPFLPCPSLPRPGLPHPASAASLQVEGMGLDITITFNAVCEAVDIQVGPHPGTAAPGLVFEVGR